MRSGRSGGLTSTWCSTLFSRQGNGLACSAAVSDDGQMSNRLSFAVSIGRTADVQELTASVQRAEAAGADTLTAADHLGSTSPFQLLAGAAAVSSRVRLRTYVLDAYFWNPALLAREVATLDSLSGGRFELGIGAGHMRHEHEGWAAVPRGAPEVVARRADRG